MPSCEICLSPMLAVIHSMREAGSEFSEIADATALDAETIELHFAQCCELTGTEPDSLQASDERLRRLQQQISLTATAGGLSGDLRTQVSALSLALRTELEIRQNLTERAAAEAERSDNLDRPVTVARLDELVKEFMAKRDAAREYPGAKAQCLLEEEPGFTKLIFAIWADRSLLQTILEGITEHANAND